MAAVSVVLVTYNALPLLERSLESVRGHESIVVDHGSTDGTVDFVRERFPDVRVIEQDNLGFGAGQACRRHAGVLLAVFALTLAVQAVRVLAMWASGKTVGIDLSVRPYYVMGPLLFLVMLVPFTINGLAAGESFFVSFLGNLGDGADEAFAAGCLSFLATITMSLPGGVILAWERLRGPGWARVDHG
jgi:uncharacterized membrane protein YbhN (UPF0104 family)